MHSDNQAVTLAQAKATTGPAAVASLAVPVDNFKKVEFNCALKSVEVRLNEENQPDGRAPIRRPPM